MAEREAAIDGATEIGAGDVDALEAAGLPCEIVTGAGTGTFRIEGASGVWNELQAGSYVFMDTDYARSAATTAALHRVRAQPLRARDGDERAGARRAPSSMRGSSRYSGEKGLPWVHGRDGLEVIGVSDEHGKIEIAPGAQRRCASATSCWLIPGHCDPTVNLHDWYVGVRGGRVEALWPITARGRAAAEASAHRPNGNRGGGGHERRSRRSKRDFLQGAALRRRGVGRGRCGERPRQAMAQMLETGIREDSSLAKIRKEGVMRVGYSQTGPWFYKDAKTGDLGGIYKDAVERLWPRDGGQGRLEGSHLPELDRGPAQGRLRPVRLVADLHDAARAGGRLRRARCGPRAAC